MSWREKVLYEMKKQNIGQKDLAKLSGVTESSVSRYLHSDKKPRLDIIINFAKALNLKTEYLLEEDNNAVSSYTNIATAVARYGNDLTPDEKNRLIALILGKGD
ncbi:MAG: helix-turn-helix transcriptional regulator [Clostridia bacterium]|nr:helix-turn-helix transcriptional regulator [Clostridia bacterium]MBR2377781.1 helix-turn-helix transcriptional regulator [Clostridia bacterium]